jgi:hypothetical protein
MPLEHALPTGPLASRLKRAGGGPVDNTAAYHMRTHPSPTSFRLIPELELTECHVLANHRQMGYVMGDNSHPFSTQWSETMTRSRKEPSKAEMFAALVTGHGESAYTMASVQRSHRFPVHVFAQIENLAKMGGVPVSMIINELLDCGLDALKAELSDEEVAKVTLLSEEQVNRATVTDKADSKAYRASRKRKSIKAV